MGGVISKEKSLVFFVDDEPEILEVFADHFSQFHDVQTFENATQLLAYFEKPNVQIPDVIVTDLKMGQLSGIEMVNQLTANDIVCPVIMLSGNFDKSSLMNAVNSGVIYVLEKPFELGQLRAYIDQILIESKITAGREQMRATMAQLKELYGHIRVICATEIPRFQEVMSETLLATGQSNLWDGEGASFEALLEKLENDLEEMMKLDDMYNGLRNTKLRSPTSSRTFKKSA